MEVFAVEPEKLVEKCGSYQVSILKIIFFISNLIFLLVKPLNEPLEAQFQTLVVKSFNNTNF